MLGIGRAGPLGPAAALPETPGEWASAPNPAAGTGPAARAPESERLAWAVVAGANEVGPATMARLLAKFGSAESILDMAGSRGARRELVRLLGPIDGVAVANGLGAAVRDRDATARSVEASGVDVLIADDPEYPPALRAIELPPPVLYLEGRRELLSRSPAVAIVGTRRPTEDGRRTAARIASALVASAATIVSGLAVGIDGAAHAAALQADGLTVAVLGGGHRRLFPKAHRRLADEIVRAGGAVVSEFGPDVEPAPWSFPRRNRIISGLSGATVVVEAGRGSGALITARWALEQGRGCFLVPGPIDASTSAGCLAFLREHAGAARIVAGIGELVADLGLPDSERAARPSPARAPGAALSEAGETERRIGRLVAAGVATVDALVAATELPVATVLAALTILETRGLVVDALGRYRPSEALLPPPTRRRVVPVAP